MAIAMLSVTSVKTVGSMKYPTFPSRFPPHWSFAPSFWPISMYRKTLLNISSSTCGPTEIILTTTTITRAFDVIIMFQFHSDKYQFSNFTNLVEYLHRRDCQLYVHVPISLLQQRRHHKFSHGQMFAFQH